MTLLLSCATLTAFALGWFDHRTGKMPNPLTLGSLVLALGVAGFGAGREGLSHALLGLLAAGSIPLGLFLATRGRAIGGGDVKALGAIGAWLGPALALDVTLTSFLVLSVFALGQQALRGELVALLARTGRLAIPGRFSPSSRRASGTPGTREEGLTEMRFGPALALGTALACGSAFLEAFS